MRGVIRWLGRLVLMMVAAAAGLWAFGPYEPLDLTARSGAVTAEQFTAREVVFSDLRTGEEKRVIFAHATHEKTPVSILYLHGFSASSEEVRPVPDKVAEALGANLVFTRFAGHGRSSPDAMGEASATDWMIDASEALAVAREVGERVVVMATSTGGSIATLAMTQPDLAEAVAGVVMISPNFAVNNPAAPLLTFPAARYWVPVMVGERRSFEPRNAGQADHWTTEYPMVATLPMARVAKAARDADHGAIKVPLMLYFNDGDRVVKAEATRAVAARWGGPVAMVEAPAGGDVDPYLHVVAGDIMSPGNTDAAVQAIVDWAKGL
jgi:pimeloyl-ACP methyl ester carboxylesterase